MIPNKVVTIFIGVFLMLGSIYLAILSWNAFRAHDYIGVSEEQRHSITVYGEGEIIGVPDIAKVQLGYSVEKKNGGRGPGRQYGENECGHKKIER